MNTTNPTFRTTLRTIGVAAWAIWTDYRQDCAERAAFEKRFPIQRDLDTDPLLKWERRLFVAALIVAISAIAADVMTWRP